MIYQKVRCWQVGQSPRLLITYPEGDLGHSLIICMNCGTVYAVNVAMQLYMEPNIDIYLADTKCIGCDLTLAYNWKFYPDNFLDEEGKPAVFERPSVIPPDSESIIVALPEIFS